MARFLFCWEIGGGLGHVGRLAPVARRLADKHHDVSVALCEPQHGPTLFPTAYHFTAPREHPLTAERIVEPSTYADIMYNAGASELARLRRIAAAWREIFAQARPDVIVLDFSPLAHLAAQGWGARTVLLATGHACPPDVTPLPDACPWRDNYPDRLRATESRVLEVVNGQLTAQGQAALERLAQLFTRVDANLLTTFPELDHYPQRAAGGHQYVGVWSELPAASPVWPAGGGTRVFAYLKTSPLAAQVLAELDRRGWPTVAFVPDADSMGWPHSRGWVNVSREPLDISTAARECDFAILHSGHNATAQLLLAGKPVLALPLSGEQQVVASNVVRLKAGEWLHPDCLDVLPRFLDRLTGDDRYQSAAAAFSRRYADWTPELQLQSVVDRIAEMARK